MLLPHLLNVYQTFGIVRGVDVVECVLDGVELHTEHSCRWCYEDGGEVLCGNLFYTNNGNDDLSVARVHPTHDSTNLYSGSPVASSVPTSTIRPSSTIWSNSCCNCSG